jgi:TatD DNase family protein
MLTDTHAHLDDPAFGAELPEVLRRAREAGVGRIVTIGTSLASSLRARDVAEREPDVWFAPGIHPHEADAPGDVDALRPLAAHPRAVAVGETGLDYYKAHATVPNQTALFMKHLEIAAEAGKPVSIHCRDAHGDCLSILRGHAPLRGVIHCFTGDAAAAEGYLSLNFFLSLAGPVTYPSAGALRDTLRHIPLESLLVETDCPLLAPQARRGQRNEPAYVAQTVAAIASVKEISAQEVEAATTANAARLFGFA